MRRRALEALNPKSPNAKKQESSQKIDLPKTPRKKAVTNPHCASEAVNARVLRKTPITSKAK